MENVYYGQNSLNSYSNANNQMQNSSNMYSNSNDHFLNGDKNKFYFSYQSYSQYNSYNRDYSILNFIKQGKSDNYKNYMNQLIKVKGKGLINLGNCCYLNALLQCFFYIPELTINFIKEYVKNPRLRNSEFSSGYYDFITTYLSTNCDSFPPQKFKDALINSNSLFRSPNGHDSKDVLFEIINNLQNELLDNNNVIFPMISSLEEELTTYISKFYDKHNILPKEVMIPDIIDSNLLESAFATKFYTPIKGKKHHILNLAFENAKNYFNEQMTIIKRSEERTTDAITELENVLKIDNISRIELFDNSNLFGTFNVSGMVVFIDGVPAKNEYRKFKITNQVNDDYNTMREVIYRRYYRVLKDKLARPDLIIVDGGIGQVNVAREVLQELYLDIPVAGLKKNEKHNTSELVGLSPIQIIPIDKKSNLFLLLTKMQDEVHNYTISYHKQIRSKGALESVLDLFPGIGTVRKKNLIKKYHTITKIQEAPLEELTETLPETVAINLKENLKNIEK